MGLDRVILDIAAFVIIVNVYYTVCLSLDVFVHLKVVSPSGSQTVRKSEP